MAKLKQIMTHKFKSEEIRMTSEEVAQKSGKDWVSVDSINQYNATSVTKKLNVFEKIVRFLFVLHPYVGLIVSTLTPPILLLPVAANALFGVNFFILAMGALAGWVAGSFIFPGLVSSCKICGAIRKCEQIYKYCLHFEEHTEERVSNNVRYKYLVRNELAFCVYECKKCKARKIEILLLVIEKQI